MEHNETYRLAYLSLSLIFSVIWLLLFKFGQRKVRQELIVVSLLFAPLGVIADFVYTIDWWKPLTITDTRLGLESILATMAIVGVGSVVLESIVGSTVIRGSYGLLRHGGWSIGLLLALMATSFLGTFYVFGLNSFLATWMALLLGLAIVWWDRQDLILPSILNGMFLSALALVVYSVIELLLPGWVEALYLLNNTPKVIVLSVPLDDFFFYFGVGTFLGGFYRCWTSTRFRIFFGFQRQKPS